MNVETLKKSLPEGLHDLESVSSQIGWRETLTHLGLELRKHVGLVVDGAVFTMETKGRKRLYGFLHNDERVHPYQRGRASITGLSL